MRKIYVFPIIRKLSRVTTFLFRDKQTGIGALVAPAEDHETDHLAVRRVMRDYLGVQSYRAMDLGVQAYYDKDGEFQLHCGWMVVIDPTDVQVKHTVDRSSAIYLGHFYGVTYRDCAAHGDVFDWYQDNIQRDLPYSWDFAARMMLTLPVYINRVSLDTFPENTADMPTN